MRSKLAIFLVLAGGIAGCASTPPPPPPMAAVEPPPPPAPAPMMSAPMEGMYKGPVVSTEDSGPRCRKMPATASTRLRNDSFTLAGMHGKVGPDGTVTSMARRGMTMTGMLTNGTLDVTTMAHGCGYHYTLSHG